MGFKIATRQLAVLRERKYFDIACERIARAQAQALTTDDRPKEPSPLSDHDRAVLALFRQLPPEKQLSLLTLLRP